MNPIIPPLVLLASALFASKCHATPASTDRVRQLAAQGSIQDAKTALRECSDDQDARCQLMLAEWIERGELFPQNMDAARHLYEQAFKNGAPEAGRHILRLLRGDKLPSIADTAQTKPGDSGGATERAETLRPTAQPIPAAPPATLLVNHDQQPSSSSRVIPRNSPTPVSCESHTERQVSMLRCGGLLLALQPIGNYENKTLILVRAENRRPDTVTLDYSQFAFSHGDVGIDQMVDTTMSIAIDERPKGERADNVVKGVLTSAISLAAAAFMHNSDLDFLDLDPAYMLADGVGEAAGREARTSFEAAQREDSTTTVGYINNIALPPASFAEGLLAVDRGSAEGMSVTFISPAGVGSVEVLSQ